MKVNLTYNWRGANCIYFIIESVDGYEGQFFTVKNDYGEVMASDIRFVDVVGLYNRLRIGWDGLADWR